MNKLLNIHFLGKLSTLAIIGLLAMSQKDICDEARLHPLLPTLKQIEADGDDVYAYHLPLKTTI
jgi:hypothetical protein